MKNLKRMKNKSYLLLMCFCMLMQSCISHKTKEIEELIKEARLLESNGKIKEAHHLLGQKMEFVNNPTLTYMLLMEEADIFNRDGAEYSAIKYYSQAIELNVNNGKALLRRGLCYIKKNNFISALEDFNKVILADSSNIEALSYRSYVSIQLKNFGQAEKDIVKAEKIKSNSIGVYNARAIYEFKVGNQEASFIYLEKALRVDSNDLATRMNLAIWFFNSNRIIESTSILSKIIQEFPFYDKALFLNCLINVKNNELENACKSYQFIRSFTVLHDNFFQSLCCQNEKLNQEKIALYLKNLEFKFVQPIETNKYNKLPTMTI